MSSSSQFRNGSIYVSQEVNMYLRVLAKAKCVGTDAVLTADAVADCLLRERMTTDYPQLVELYSELDKAKQDARASYQEIETKMVEAVRE